MKKVRTIRKRKQGKPTIAKKVATLSKQVKHLVVLEKEAMAYETDTRTAQGIAQAGAVVYLFVNVPVAMVNEPDYLATNRSIKANYLHMTYRYTISNGAFNGLNSSAAYSAITSPTIRVIVFQDWGNEQALPAVTDVLLTANVNAPYNKLNNKRFTIKYDKTHCINIHQGITTTGGYITEVQHHVARIKFAKNRTIEYITGGNTIAAASRGQVFTLYVTDTANAGTSLVGSVPLYNQIAELTYETL